MKKRNDLISWMCAAVIAATLPMSAYAKAKNSTPTLSADLTASPLEQSFNNPPASAQAWCYWWWLNGLASKEGITRDFEEMKKQGISGALLFDAETGGPGVPQGPVFMGPEWRELFKFAVSKADRLINAGCAIPPDTPSENIRAMVETTHQYSLT